jgi:hypothetical protein
MYFELRLHPTVSIITAVRQSVTSIFDRVLADADATARVALATHELLENALRHSTNGDTLLNIRVDPPSHVVQIETRNQATPAAIEKLQQKAKKIATGDPDDRYLEAMQAAVLNNEIGGLGLVRIRAEGSMDIDVTADGDTVCVIASTKYGAAA